MIVPEGYHYLYRHIRPDTKEVFYIGVGTKCSASYPYMRAKSSVHRNPHWHNIKNKSGFVVEIMIESNNYPFILQKESEFIKLYRRKDLGIGLLVNMTDGGEGCVGTIRTKEWTDKIATSNRNSTKPRKPGVSPSMETREKIRNSNLGVKRSEETKRRVKLARAKQDTSGLGVKVLQYDLAMNFIKEWDSLAQVKREINVSNIRRAVLNDLTAGGCKWKYK